MTPLLSVRGLEVAFAAEEGPSVCAVRGVDLDVHEQETVALVGESGCGKSATALALLGLLPRSAKIEGVARFRDTDLLSHRARGARRVRGSRVAMVFQDPLTALNPYIPVGNQVAESIRRHLGHRRRAALDRAASLFRDVGMPDPDRLIRAFPHELSGGLRQRVLIAMALAGDPELIIADEPTTALDVTVQAQILELFRTLCRERGLSLLLISHDLGVVAGMADRVVVLYAGQVVEAAPVRPLFATPQHPYTRGLLASLPARSPAGAALPTIAGRPPDPREVPPGCPFHPRCGDAIPTCRAQEPQLLAIDRDHQVACPITAPSTGAST